MRTGIQIPRIRENPTSKISAQSGISINEYSESRKRDRSPDLDDRLCLDPYHIKTTTVVAPDVWLLDHHAMLRRLYGPLPTLVHGFSRTNVHGAEHSFHLYLRFLSVWLDPLKQIHDC